MKINLNLPTLGNIFSHDAPLYQIIKFSVPVFILISSLTVFGGVRSHISDYLQSYSWLVTVPGYGFAYTIFSLAPDVLNSILAAYIVRSLLNKYKQGTDIILNVFALILVVFLTRYSYNMSQFSAGAVSSEIGQETEVIDLSEINDSYSTEKKEINDSYKTDKQDAENQYNENLGVLNQKYENLSNPLREKIQKFEKNRTDDNTKWTDREIRKVQNQITSTEKLQIEEQQKLLKEKQDKIAGFQATRDQSLAILENNKKTDRNTTQSLKEKKNAEIDQANGFLQSELEKIAGYAIFVVLVLVSLKEIIHFRNNVEPKPILSQLDFQYNWIQEVIGFPYEYLRRHAVNYFREQYDKLPQLKDGIEVPELIQQSHTQKVIELVPSEPEQLEQDYTFFRRGISAKSRAPFNADEKNRRKNQKQTNSEQTKQTKKTDETDKQNTRKKQTKQTNQLPEMRQAKQRLTQYKKDLAKHKQKGRLQKKSSGKISPRTQKAIDNNQSWVDHWQDILNGGNGTRN